MCYEDSRMVCTVKNFKNPILWKDQAIRELRGRGWLSHEKPWQANQSSLGHTHG